MNKLRGILLGFALALPLAAVGSSSDVSAIGDMTAAKSTMTQIQTGPASERCCFVWFMGSWWCIPC